MGLLGQREVEQLVVRPAADEARMLLLDVALDLLQQVVLVVAADRRAAARAREHQRHYSPPSPRSASSFASACLAAACSASFFDLPRPTPASSPSIIAAVVK